MINSISIITPFYNTNDYMIQYFESLKIVIKLLETNEIDFEYILIDDFSDLSEFLHIEEIFNKLECKEKKIIRNSENLGTYHSYWRGINESIKDYVIIVDSDDELSTYLINFLKEYRGNDELIIFGDNYSNSNLEMETFKKKSKNEILVLLLKNDKFINLMKIIKRSLIINTTILESSFRFAPDFHISTLVILAAKSIKLDGQPIIKLNRRFDSVSGSYLNSYHEDILSLFSNLINEFYKSNIELSLIKLLRTKFYDYLLYDIIAPQMSFTGYIDFYLLLRNKVKGVFFQLSYEEREKIIPRKSMLIVHRALFFPKYLSLVTILVIKLVYNFRRKFIVIR